MKRIIIAAALMALLVGGCALSHRYLSRQSQQMAQLVEQAGALARQGDVQGAYDKLCRFQKEWESRRTAFAMLVRHEEMDEIDQLLPRAMALLQAESGGEFLAESAAILHNLEHIVQMESVSLANIF